LRTPLSLHRSEKLSLASMEEVFDDGEQFGAIDDGECPLRNEVDGKDEEGFVAVFGVVFTEDFLHVHGIEL